MRSGLPGRERGRFIARGNAPGVDLTDSRARSWRLEVNGRRAVAEGHIDRPRRGGIRFVMPNESWRRDLRRKGRPILRIVHSNHGRIGATLGESVASIS